MVQFIQKCTNNITIIFNLTCCQSPIDENIPFVFLGKCLNPSPSPSFVFIVSIMLLQRPHSVRRERDQHLHAGLGAEKFILRGLQYQVICPGTPELPIFLALSIPRYLPTPSPSQPSESDQKAALPVPGLISSDEEEEVVISGNLRKKTKSHLMMKQRRKVKH